VLEVLAVIAIVAYVIGRQLLGESLRGKRVLLLPAILTVVGLTRLGGGGHHVHPADVACLVVSGVIAAAIGAGQGAMMRLENRDGGLWGRMPATGLLLWVALIGSRLVMTVVASALGAHVAASTAPIVLMLGVNRLGQAALITRRALAAGIPFAREKDGKVFLADQLSGLGTRLTGQDRPDTSYGPRDSSYGSDDVSHSPRDTSYSPDDASYGRADGYGRYGQHGPYDDAGRDRDRDRGDEGRREQGWGEQGWRGERERGSGIGRGRGFQDGPIDGLGGVLRDLRGGRGRDRRGPRRYR
jgi:hypothetical protein